MPANDDYGREDVGPDPCHCGKPAEPGSHECHSCLHGMPPLPRVLCCGWEDSYGAHHGCVDAVIQRGDFGGQKIVGTCPRCLALGTKAQSRMLLREAHRTERRAARRELKHCFMADPFAGFRDGE